MNHHYRITPLILALLAACLLAGDQALARARSGLQNSITYLATRADWYFESGQNGAELGYAVAAAGEPNDMAGPFSLDRFRTGFLIDEAGAAAVAH